MKTLIAIVLLYFFYSWIFKSVFGKMPEISGLFRIIKKGFSMLFNLIRFIFRSAFQLFGWILKSIWKIIRSLFRVLIYNPND